MKKYFYHLLVILLMSSVIISVNQVYAQKRSEKIKWKAIKSWSGSFTIAKKISKQATENGITESIEVKESTNGSMMLDDKYADGNMVTWQGSCNATTKVSATRILSYGEITITETINGTSSSSFHLGENSAGISIDLDGMTYGIGFCGASEDFEYERKFDEATKEAINAIEEEPIRDYFKYLITGLEASTNYDALRVGIGILPGNFPKEFTDIMNYVKQMENYQPPTLPSSPTSLSGTEHDDISNTTTSWSFFPDGHNPNQLFIEKCPVEWMPSDIENNNVTIKVLGNGWFGEKVKMKFTLFDVTNEKGSCLNSPDQNEFPDLDFNHSGNKALFNDQVIASNNVIIIETKDEVMNAEIKIACYDWGAWGQLKVEIKPENSSEWILIKTKNGESSITIPLDEDNNSIADCWQQEFNIGNLFGDDDSENKPPGNSVGDGFTLYEEYRGFLVAGKHIRLNPEIKDLFILDRDGLVKNCYLEGIISPTNIHYLNQDELSMPSRVINKNYGRYNRVIQHALYIIKDKLPKPDKYNWGVAHGKELGPPKTADPKISIYTEQISRDLKEVYDKEKQKIIFMQAQKGVDADINWLEKQIDEAIKSTTIHELGHGIGIGHHIKSLPPNNDGQISPSYGSLMCVMRYPWHGSSDKIKVKYIDEMIFRLTGQIPWPNIYCDIDDNCISQILISDEGY